MNIQELQSKTIEYREELSENEKAERTALAYLGDIQNFFKWVTAEGGKAQTEELSKSDVIAYKEKLRADGYKTSTINCCIISVNKFLKWAGADNATGTKTLRQQQKASLDNIMTLSEYERMLNAALSPGKQAQAAGLKPDPQAWAIMQTLAGSGCRFGEIAYFTVEALKAAPSNGDTITVTNKGKERSLPVNKDLQKLLKEYCKAQGITEGYIFGTRNGTPISNPQISRRLKKIAGYARINRDKIHPHNFRHLFAKRYMEEINRIDELKDILGHSSIATTSIYTRTSNKGKASNTGKLGMIKHPPKKN